MDKKIVKVVITRTYTKSTSVLITVDETMTQKDISDFVAFDTNTNRKIEAALDRASLDSGEDELQYIETP